MNSARFVFVIFPAQFEVSMKKMLLLSLVISVLNVQSFGQKGWLGGIKGGISIPKLRAPSDGNGSYSNGFHTVVGPQFGVLAEYRFNSFFSLQTEFNYSTQGGEKNGDQRIRTKDFNAYIPTGANLPDYIYATFNNRISLVYLELPLMAKFSFKISPASRIAMFGGPYFGYLIRAEGKATGQSKIYTDPVHTRELSYNGFPIGVVDFNRNEDIMSMLKRTNYGLQGGASVEYTTKKLNYFMAVGGTLGFERLQKDPNFGDNKTGGLTLSVGVTHKL